MYLEIGNHKGSQIDANFMSFWPTTRLRGKKSWKILPSDLSQINLSYTKPTYTRYACFTSIQICMQNPSMQSWSWFTLEKWSPPWHSACESFDRTWHACKSSILEQMPNWFHFIGQLENRKQSSKVLPSHSLIGELKWRGVAY